MKIKYIKGSTESSILIDRGIKKCQKCNGETYKRLMQYDDSFVCRACYLEITAEQKKK